MLTQTTITAMQMLACLALRGDAEPVPPRQIARHLRASPSYLAKIASMLVKAGLLSVRHGAHGGVALRRPPDSITLYDVYVACEGRIRCDFCLPNGACRPLCEFHQVMEELHQGLAETLRRHTLWDIAVKSPRRPGGGVPDFCKMDAANAAARALDVKTGP